MNLPGIVSGRKAFGSWHLGAPPQQPRQIDPSSIFWSRASSLSMVGSVPSNGPFITWPPTPDGSAVPEEFVPGAAPLVPSAPPPDIDMCDPIPPRANAACENARQAANKRNKAGFMGHSTCCDDLH